MTRDSTDRMGRHDRRSSSWSMAPTDDPLRLLLTTWQDFGAGSVQSVQYLATGLFRRGHDVLVATPKEGVLGRRLTGRDVPVVNFRFRWGWNPVDAARLAEIARRHRADLVDAQESRDRKAAILARWVFRAKFPLVITRRQLSSSFFLEDRLYAAASDRIVAISEAVADSLVSSGVPRDHLEVVHTGLDPDRISGDVRDQTLERLRESLNLDSALPTIGVVSRRKRQETLLRAVVAMGRPVNVVMVGIQADPCLQKEAEALPEGTRLAYTGFVEDVRPYLDLLDVKVLPTHREGLSQALLEAMGRGVPVITSAAGGTVEVVEDGVNGLQYPPGNAKALAAQLDRLLDDEDLRDHLRQNALATVRRRFTVEQFVLATEAVYRRVLGRVSE